MQIFPAIDLYEGKAVRLYKGDYQQMTVYNPDPTQVVRDFIRQGAQCVHLVDLEGAKTGQTPNLDTVTRILREGKLFTEIGGGIRSMQTAETYLNAGVDRVILGTAAVTDPEFLHNAVREFGDKIAVGVDIRDGFVAIKGWTESSADTFLDFCKKMQDAGVSCLICTDISRDGAMQGTNRALYRELSQKLRIKITASGGVSSIEDVKALAALDIYGAIIGKAYYTGAIDLRQAIEVAK